MNQPTPRVLARLPRYFSPNQWIMAVALSAIIGCMLLTSKAWAIDVPYVPYNQQRVAYDRLYTVMTTPRSPMKYKGQVMSHCGSLPTRNIIYTNKHRNVRVIQTKLEMLGYAVGRSSVDGRYGPRTRRAIRQFQKDHQLRIDGVFGTNTARMLAYASHPAANVRRCQHHAERYMR